MGRIEPVLTGNAVVDAEHRELFALIDALVFADARPEGDRVGDVLDQLLDYAFVHFQMEEKLMRREEYPAAAFEAHVAEHRAFDEKVHALAQEYEAGELTSVQKIADLLYRWFEHHIAEVDTAMATYIRRKHSL